MPLKQNMTKAEIDDYLKNDLSVSVRNDILPCLSLGGSAGGYFGVPKLVMT